jgi:hypothetical protein
MRSSQQHEQSLIVFDAILRVFIDLGDNIIASLASFMVLLGIPIKTQLRCTCRRECFVLHNLFPDD